MIVNQQNLTGVFNGFNVLFNQGFEGVKPQYEKVCMIVPSESSEETYEWIGKMSNLREWIGSRQIKNLSAYSYVIKNKDFELTVAVPRNAIADDNIGVFKPLIQNMGESAKLHPDSLVFYLLANGFKEKTYDGSEYFSDNHPIYINGKKVIQSNKGTKKLTALSYAEARSKMMILKGEDNESLKIIPDLLVVSPQNEAKAREILFADLINGSTNVNKNTCELLVAPELADWAEQWYLLSTKRSIRPLIFQVREKPVFVTKTSNTDDNVFYDNQFLYGVNARYNAGYGLWQLAYGSTGEVNE